VGFHDWENDGIPGEVEIPKSLVVFLKRQGSCAALGPAWTLTTQRQCGNLNFVAWNHYHRTVVMPMIPNFFDRSQQGNPYLFFYINFIPTRFNLLPQGIEPEPAGCYSSALTTKLETLSRQ